jgi:hypothetical protein
MSGAPAAPDKTKGTYRAAFRFQKALSRCVGSSATGVLPHADALVYYHMLMHHGLNICIVRSIGRSNFATLCSMLDARNEGISYATELCLTF